MAEGAIAKNRFLVLGRAGLDLYAEPAGTRAETAASFSAALGGSAANIAVAIVRLGGEASLVTTVSDDAVGRHVTLELQRYRVGSTLVRMAGGEARTSLAVVETRLENTQSVIYRNGAADFELDEDQVRSADYGAHGALIVTGTALAREPSRSATFLAVRLARAAGLCVVLDIDYRPYSWPDAGEAARINREAVMQSDVVIGNDAEYSVVFGARGLKEAEALAIDGARTVVYKMGEKGSIAFRGRERIDTGVYRVAALKPTGAGDAFMGGFITGMATGAPLAQCILRGTAAAAIVVTRVGCAPAMPDLQELAAFMAENHVAS